MIQDAPPNAAPDSLKRNSDLLDYIERKVRDAQLERGKHESQWVDNARLTLGAHREVFASNTRRQYVAADLINNAVVIQWSVATETPPRVVFKPRETNEPPHWFLRPASAFKLDQIPGHGLDMNQAAGLAPIPDDVAQQLLAFQATQSTGQWMEQSSPLTGEPEVVEATQAVPVLTEQDFIAVTDELAAEALTQELATEWDMSGCDEFMAQHIFENICYGSRQMLFAWNADDYRGYLVDLYPFNVWVDRWSKTNHDGEYVVIRQVVPIREAIKEFPKIPREAIRDLVDQSNNDGVFGTGAMRGGKYDSLRDRDVVYRWTLYERNALFPMTPEEAMEQGRVQPAVATSFAQDVDPMTGQVTEQPIEEPVIGQDGQPMYELLEEGQVAGERTQPGMANWPQRAAVRQVDLLGDIEIYNGECELADIPVARNKNIPIPDSPYGQGTPHRLAPLNEFYNRLLTLMREYTQYFALPQKVAPTSVVERMQQELGTMWSSAKEVLGVPDDTIHEFGGDIARVIQTLDPPQLQSAMIQLIELVGTLIDRVGGTTDVLRGEAKSEWSGETVGKLQSAARGPIGAQSRATAYALKYLGDLWGKAIVKFLPAKVWAERNTAYPPQVFEAMRQRILKVGVDAIAEVAGAGPKEAKFQRLVNLVNSVPTLMQSPSFVQMFFEAAELNGAENIARELAQLSAPPPPIA